MQEGIDGLLRDKTRPSRIPPLGPEVAERVVSLTCRSRRPRRPTGPVPDGRACGISASAVHRIWRAHGLQPHKYQAVQAFQRSEIRGEAARCGRALYRSAGPCHRPVVR